MGLVSFLRVSLVVSSCNHCGVINAMQAAMAVSGVDKLRAVLGGFHSGVAPPDYVEHTIAEMKALAPNVVVPMHCTGRPSSPKCTPGCPTA